MLPTELYPYSPDIGGNRLLFDNSIAMLNNGYWLWITMSIREMIRIIHEFDADRYLSILQEEHNAIEHPSQPDAFMVDELPFYRPGQTDEYVYIVSFNHVPLPSVLIDALANYPELVPDETLVFWSVEDTIFLETTMGEQRGNKVNIDPTKREEWRKKSQTLILLL